MFDEIKTETMFPSCIARSHTAFSAPVCISTIRLNLVSFVLVYQDQCYKFLASCKVRHISDVINSNGFIHNSKDGNESTLGLRGRENGG